MIQDIGGVRVVLNNCEEVYKLKTNLEKEPTIHKIRKVKDYIATPKLTGYRGVHIIYSLINKKDKTYDWSKLKVELQIRTRLQHIWATTLEIYDFVNKTTLKTQSKITERDKSWLEFFELVASLFAYAEKQPILPQYQDIGIRGVVKRLNEIKAKKIKKLKAIRYRISLNSKTKNKKNPNEKIKYKNDDLILVSLKIDKYNSNESPDVKVFNKK